MIVERLVSEKSDRMTWRSEWMPRLEKFSEKSFRALSSRNHTWEGVGLEEEDALERKGFWDGVDLHLGAITQTISREREREREKQKNTTNIKIKEYKELKVRMHVNAWACGMQ